MALFPLAPGFILGEIYLPYILRIVKNGNINLAVFRTSQESGNIRNV